MKGAESIAAAVAIAAAAGGAAAGITWASRADFARSLQLAAANVRPSLSAEARALLVAHGAFESGFGTGAAARRGFNVFNLTAGSAWRGETWTQADADDEYRPDGSVVRIDQVWRVYPSLEAAVSDYWEFLGPTANRGRYVAARSALERGDLPSFTAELYRAGYFTLPAATYAQRLERVRLEVKGYLA